jgi:hypothetical protein
VDPFTVVVRPSTDIVVCAAIEIVAPFKLALDVADIANSAPVKLVCCVPFTVVVIEVSWAVFFAVVEQSAADIVKLDVADKLVSADEVKLLLPVLFMVKVP